MTAVQVIDIDALLAPISDEQPAGIDPRSDTSSASLYYRTKDARNAARSAERASVDIGGSAPEEWDVVLDTATEILAGHAKDLEIASWLIEALVRKNGFAGLRDGLKVMTGIATDFWGQCFPEIDEDGVEGKVAAVAGLNGSGAVGTLIQPIRLTHLTHGSQFGFSLWSYEQATDLEKITDPKRRQERVDSGAVTMEQFLQSVGETSPAELAATVKRIDECLEALREMSAAFDQVAGTDAPPISSLRDLLDQTNSAVRHFAADKLAAAAYSDPAIAELEADGSAPAAGGDTAGGAVRRIDGYSTREEALTELVRIASYFRKTEPHSPISYTLEDAVRRARMTLPELLHELAEDPTHIKRILMAAGIKDVQAA